MGETKIVKTSCAVCGACCEIDAYVEDGKLVSVEGAKNTPMQEGGMCAKGVAAAQFEYNPERILYPMKRIGEKGEGKFARISWDEAYDMIAEKSSESAKAVWPGSDSILRGISQVVPSGHAPVCQSVWIAEFLHRVQYLFSGGGAGVEVHLRKQDLRTGS